MSPSPGDALVSCVKKVPTDVMGKDYTQHDVVVAVVPPPAGPARTGDATPQETYSFQKLK
ncbi:hypothetical protein [Enterobacter roggenkampii]|uniref:hypothetical protein n=1 Tax=Enterobacter roggenkampii TaxID=1812935 RepID=UPI000FDA21C5|nr:hypothetical protein [Enterobacter roggenkampii]